MFRKMMMAAPLAGVLAMSPAASDQQVHAAQFSPPSNVGASPLLQLVRGGGGVIINGGGHGGGGFGGGRMGGGGGGSAFRGGIGYGGAGRSFGGMGSGRRSGPLFREGGMSSGRGGPFFREGGMSGGRSVDRPGRMAIRSFDRMPNGGFEGSSSYIRRGDRANLYRRDFSGNGMRHVAHGGDGDAHHGHDHNGHHHHHHGHFFFFNGSFYDDYYDYANSYYSDCEWLRLRAVSTGSSYWWHRYQVCEDSY
jgi:hypothetical protein